MSWNMSTAPPLYPLPFRAVDRRIHRVLTMERGNHRRPRSRGLCGANPAWLAGSADLARASPSANPVGSTQGGSVQLKRVFVAMLCVLGFAVSASAAAAANTGG